MPWKRKSPSIHRTPLYRARAAFSNMRRRCGNKTGADASYHDVELRMTEEEWLNWSLPLYEQFIEDYPNESPCVSRIGDSGHYEIGNIEIISVKENRDRQRRVLCARSDGTKLCGRCRQVKQVSEFSKNRVRPDGLAHECRECHRTYYHKQKKKKKGRRS